jgi:hypothetical protein
MHKLGALVLVAMFSGANAQTLQARDINGDGTADAYYDSQQDLTWLADANFAATSGYWDSLDYSWYPAPLEAGRMSQGDSAAWADQLDVHGVTDWRLPLLLDTPTVNPSIGAPPGTPCSAVSGWLCEVGENEMTVLFSQLGGAASPFVNVQDFEYWTGSNFGLDDAWAAYAARGDRASGITDEVRVPVYAWAVRDGDVTLAVPEPSTYALMLAGLALMCAVARRRVGGPAAERGAAQPL